MERSVEEVLPEIIPYLKKCSWKYVNQLDDVNDLVSETCLKVLRYKSQFEGNENDFQKWCYTILRNIYINDWRKQIYRGTDIVEESDMILYSNLQRFSESIDNELIYNQLEEFLIQTLSPSDYRLFMGMVNGFSYEQLAEILEKPLGTIKSRIFLVREKLKMKYEEFERG